MRVTSATILFILSVVSPEWISPLSAQQLPADARPWQVIRTLIQETGSPINGVDREAFRVRLTGEAATLDTKSLKGTWPPYTDVNIDTIISLPARIRHVPGNPKLELPPRNDTIERSAVYVTTYVNGLYDNCYFFCERDSIWRIESWRQFPTPEQRETILTQVKEADSTAANAFQTRIKLMRLLLSDADLSELFADIAEDADMIVPQLIRSAAWDRLDLADIPFDSIDEYDALDDRISPANRLFYRLNLSALRRLQDFGIDRISRTSGEKIMVLLELGTVVGETVGFAYAVERMPPPDKEEFYTLKPLRDNWWLFKRRRLEQNEAGLRIGPSFHSPEEKSGKASRLVPK